MVIFYFSGTGNSKYIAELFGKNMNAECFSIEENLNFENLINNNETIAFCYPVYASREPRIMREFVKKHMEFFEGKKLIIFCTQLLFSGDGARALTYLFPRDFLQCAQVIYAEHFFMPSNIFPVTTDSKKIKKYFAKSTLKMQKVCVNIKHGKIRKRGFNPLSRVLGLIQPPFLRILEKKANNSIRITANCTNCGLCISACPMKNLALENKKITHNHNCTVCYRCVNLCPEKAITVAFHGKIKGQYRGLN
jgi:ferredoxin